MIDVVNLQRKIKLELAPIRSFVADLRISLKEAQNKTFTVAFVSDNRMKQLNEMFRGRSTTTDVLSFPYEPDEFDNCSNSQNAGISMSDRDKERTQEQADGPTLPSQFIGDIVISAEQAERQAGENRLTLEDEIKQLILHGLLHLCGYDHESDNGEMNQRELELREQLCV
jgi:probable rRNA maturation factor